MLSPQVIAKLSTPQVSIPSDPNAKYGQREVNVEILLKDGKLFLKQGPNELPISKTGENRFSAAPPRNASPLEFALVTGSDGKVEYFQGGLRAARRVNK